MVSTFVLLLSTIVVIGALKFFFVVRRYFTHWKNKGIPFVPGYKNLLISWKAVLGYMTFTDLSEGMYYHHPDVKYFGGSDFTTFTIFLRDLELIKDITVKDFDHFTDHRVFIDENVEPMFGKNIFSLRGDRWREMRNTLSPSFTASKMKFMFELISRCSHDFVNYLAEHPELYSTLDTSEIFKRYTNDVIATAAFGVSVNSMEDNENEFYKKGKEIGSSSFGVPAMLRMIFLASCPRLAKLLGITFVPTATSRFFKNVVRETIRVREERNVIRPDMIHLLMQARNKDGQVHKIELDDIVSQAFNFFFAGFDLSSRLMCFVAHELAVHRDIQDRLREEIQRHLAEGNSEISYESLMRMTYMDMVVTETLRKYPPLLFIDRICVKKYELPPAAPGYKSMIVEPDDILMFPVYSLHHDPKYFPDPEKFDPERFNEENKDKVLPYYYLPFGQGPRKCIANRFVLMETKILIAHLLLKFNLKTVERTVEPIVFSKKEFILTPANGFWIGLEKRDA
ncbi:hypothetical protein PUN28_014677 [Cardiocondyla obscurior]|uniref:Cytochrome P450 n=1 Tax=Cardiocondyla obscurior TaxID=286306 RepID=A0AAW2EXE0_9HYME